MSLPLSDFADPCPLITPFTRATGIPDELLEKLYKLRQWKVPDDGPIPFKWPTRLRATVWDILRDIDSGVALVPKQYQLQMAQTLSRMPRFIDGDSVGLGKTLEEIISQCWLFDRIPGMKVIVFTTKSTTGQWADEYRRFTTLRPRVMQDKHGKLKSYAARLAQLKEFLEGDTHDVLIVKYSSMIGKRRKVEGGFDEDGNPAINGKERVATEVRRFIEILKPHGPRLLMTLDECQKFKTPGSSTRNMVQILARPCARVHALTATVIKNGLDEMYSIASAIGITPFGYMSEFEEEFCIFRDVHIGNGKHKRVLQGYRNVAKFKAGMRPFFWGRSQRQVNEPLPRLSTTIHPIDLDDDQRRLLLEDIPSGAYQLPPSIIKLHGEIVTRDRDPENEMTLLSVFQLVANHPGLLDPTNKKEFLSTSLSPKEEALLDMLDGDYRGEKVICYSKSRTWIDRLQWLTENGYFTDRKFLRITGKENEAQRNDAKRKFQDPQGDNDLIFINAAATEGVNLQQAAHLICLDLPWSFGDMLQLVGRMVRMASPHSACTLHILSARGSIDEYAIDTLRGKKTLFEKILGESHSAGLMDDREFFDMSSGMEQTAKDSEFLALLKAHVKPESLRIYLSGDKLAAEEGGPSMEGAPEPTLRKRSSGEALLESLDRWGCLVE